MNTAAVDSSSSLEEARQRFSEELGAWMNDCIERYQDTEPTDGHDQLTYTTGWEPYIVSQHDERAVQFMKAWRDRVRDHFVANGSWRHGYWRTQEAHHGTEHYELFLGSLHRIDPEDDETKRQLEDAAEHLGNWVPEIVPWSDESTGLFCSFHFGTDGVGEDRTNQPAHLRCVNMCLLAYDMTGKGRYLDLAARHTGLWADAILSGDSLPVGLLPSGPVYEPSSERQQDAVMRVEAILASGGIGTMLKLWGLTGQEGFRSAAERLLDVLAAQLHDPDAGPAADAIRLYRRLTGDTRYDAAIRQATSTLDPLGVREVGIESARRQEWPLGIGKRIDMPHWYEDGRPRRHNPILLALAAEVERDRVLATCALDLGRTYLSLARRSLPDGRRHGCAANSISAVARGHGRDNHAGMVTAVLHPLSEAFNLC